MTLPIFDDLNEMSMKFNQLAAKFSRDPIIPLTGKDLVPFAVAISLLAEQIKALNDRLAYPS
jgi:hypothetical protein